MSFLRHWEIYRSDEWLDLRERRRKPPLPAHRLDEFPIGYSWRVALQHCPFPLHRSRLIVEQRSIDGKNYFRPGATVP